MAITIRKFISNISNRLKSKVSPSRRVLQVPICVSFTPESGTGRLTTKREPLSIKGETKDLSATGIAFILDSIRLREYYLVGENRVLDVVLELPLAKIKMKLIGQRYEQIGEHLSVNKYLIGASIESMNHLDREIYNEYLHKGNKFNKENNSILEFEASKS